MDVDDAGWRRIALYLMITLASVFAPGAVILACLAIWRTTSDSNLIDVLQKSTADDVGALRFLWIAGGIGLAYLVGYFARALGFLALEVTRRVSKRSSMTVAGLKARVTARLGEDAWQRAMDAHPTLTASLDDPARGADLVSDEKLFDAFIYCKLWLRRMAPALNIDAIELEINVLCGSLAPLVAVTLLAGSRSGLSGWGWVAAAVVAVAVAAVIMRNALKGKENERYEAVRNVVADTTMRRAAASFQTSATGTTALAVAPVAAAAGLPSGASAGVPAGVPAASVQG